MLAAADVVGSTAVLLKYATEHPDATYIVATEAGILYEMKKKCPTTEFIPVPPEITEGAPGCSCNQCEYMKMNTLDKLYACLKDESPAIEIPQDIARDAVKPIIRMLEMS